MSLSAVDAARFHRSRHLYLRPSAPLCFPKEAEMPETRRHLEQRTALFEIVRDAFRDRATVGSEQFVYWDPTDPGKCCAPDLFVRIGEPDACFDTWKVWERGAPQLVVEIISASDAAQGQWDRKLESIRRLGASEVVRFDAEDRDHPLRIWDGIDGDLVERDSSDPGFWRCDTLGVFFCVRGGAEKGPTLRLARDSEGQDLFLTPEEGLRCANEARRSAELRVAELEAELARRRGG